MATAIKDQKIKMGGPRAVLFGYNQSITGKLYDLLNSPEYLQEMDFQKTSYNAPLKCDLALALLSRNDPLEKYLEDIITLKTRNKISMVIALIDSRQKEAFTKVKNRCLANKIVYYPLNTAKLAEIVTDELGIPKPEKETKPKKWSEVIQSSAAVLIEESTARTHTCIAVKSEKKNLTVAMIDTSDLNLIDLIRDQTGMVVKAIAADKEEIKQAIEEYYSKGPGEFTGLSGSAKSQSPTSLTQASRLMGMDTEIQTKISALVLNIIGNGIRDRATDIHIEASASGLILKYRIDGDLRRVLSPQADSKQAIVNTIKMLAGMNIEERNLAQEGKFTLNFSKFTADLNVSCVPTLESEKLVLSVINKETFEPKLNTLGLQQRDLQLLQKYLNAPYGMIVVSGPKGSGKSSTLYGLLKEVMTESKNLVTIEESILNPLPDVTQIKVDPALGFTTEIAAKTLQSQDPDIIMIDPVKDKFTSQLITKMALTGHQGFASIESSTCLETIGKLKDLGVTSLSLGSALNLVLSQRLLKKICPVCKVPIEQTEELLHSLGLKTDQSYSFFKARGCDTCHATGYKGSMGIFELLPFEKNIRKLILKDAPEKEIAELMNQQNIKSLKATAIELAARGETTVEQALAI